MNSAKTHEQGKAAFFMSTLIKKNKRHEDTSLA